MSTTSHSHKKDEMFQKANRYCIAALLALSLAIGILTAGEFLTYPISPWGIFCICVGIISMLLCILFFALYSHYLRQSEKTQ
jgi:hypothetical protein